MIWKLLSKWVSRAISWGTGACQRQEQIVTLFGVFSLPVLRSIIHHLEVRHQPWKAVFWGEYFLTFLFLRNSLPCCCFVKASLWQQCLEEKAEKANTLPTQAWATDVFPFQASKAAATKALLLQNNTLKSLSLRRHSLPLLSSLFHRYQMSFLSEVTALAHT